MLPKFLLASLALSLSFSPSARAQTSNQNLASTFNPQVKIKDGPLIGSFDAATQLRVFKGIPFAAPPVGALRWREPQPVQKWREPRLAHSFGPRAMQLPLYGDMVFRSDGMSEDCLYLNVWTPAKTAKERLPVMVYFYGGGYKTGDGSEGRYQGDSMAKRGIVAVTVNYRVGVFGFLAHPALTAESKHLASGNYGLLDQNAALRWVNRNIAAFGGDPRHITIAGESAGSSSVSAQMDSPLSKGLFAGAIGESGSILGDLKSLSQAGSEGASFAAGLSPGASPTLADLRALPAQTLLQATAKEGLPDFRPIIDGYFLPLHPAETYAAGRQSKVPLLAGVNSEESGASGVLKREPATLEAYRAALTRLYGDRADAVFALYPAKTDAEVNLAARDLAGDRFIRFNTWKWIDLATKTGGKPTYFYEFARPRPSLGSETRSEEGNAGPGRGAVHSAEIEYALGNLGTNRVYAWTPDDVRVSQQMQNYFVNFIKTGNPNGAGLMAWPKFESGQRLVIDVMPHSESNRSWRARYDLLDLVGVK